MINQITTQFFRFLGLLLMQVLVVNNLDINFYVNPYIYPLFIMALPFQIPLWLLIILGFFTGLAVDAFSNTMGMHAAACTALAFARPLVLRLITPRHSYESIDEPRLHTLGYAWFISYTALMIFFHHFIYFYLEIFSFDNFFLTLSKILLSGIVSTLLIVLTVMIFAPGKKR